MALAVSYPGVYVQAIIQPSPPDSGVATSLAAFIGRAPMGPVNTPVLLNSWGDYQRFFGGLDEDSSMSYQVSAFFNNGGGQALGVRLFEPAATDAEIAAQIDTQLTAATAAVTKAYAGGATPTKVTVVGNVNAVFQSAITAGGVGAVAGQLLADQWTIAAATLPTTPLPTQAQATTALGLIVDGPYSFAASLSLNPLNPINLAITQLFEILQLQVLANGTMEEVNLLVGSLVSNYAGQPTVNTALTALQTEIAVSANPAAAINAVAAGLPASYQAAVPVLTQTSDATYGPIATDATGAAAALAALTAASAVGTVATADYTLQQAASGITLAALKTAVAGYVTTNYLNDTAGAGALSTAVGAATTIALAQTAATAAVAKLVPATPATILNAANATLTAYAASPTGNLVLALSQGFMEEVSGEWPAAGALVLKASSQGAWGNGLTASVTAVQNAAQVAQSLGVADPTVLFNLSVTYTAPSGLTQSEQFTNVTLSTDYPALFLGNVLEAQSQFVTFGSGTTVLPGSGGAAVGGQESEALSMTTYLGDQNAKTGLYALEKTPIFNILCIPPDEIAGDTANLIYQTAAEYCVQRNAMLIVDPPSKWEGEYAAGNITSLSLNDLGSFGADEGRSSAIYFPRVLAADPLRNGQIREFPNSGYMAGIWAQTDVQYGVWKAPAGLNAAINGIAGLPVVLSDSDNGVLNPLGINCLRTFPIGGSVVWGARTLRGADQLGDQYNYIPVRRLLLYLMDWTLQNTKWAVFQPNDESLWSGLRTQLSTMLTALWKQGALFGTSADQAFFVNCDATTTLQSDIDAGRVNVQIGFAPVKPAEFVIVTLQQIAGQS